MANGGLRRARGKVQNSRCSVSAPNPPYGAALQIHLHHKQCWQLLTVVLIPLRHSQEFIITI